MKYIKMIGLAAVAAMALTAFVGAGTASATTLESEGKVLPKGTTIFASLSSGSSAVLSSGSTTLDTCTAGTVHGVTNQETAEEITGEATVTWGEPGTECTNTTDTLKGGTIGITWIEGTTNGTVRSYGAEVTVFTLGVTCTYGTAATGTHLGTLVGTAKGHATLEINAVVEKKAGGFLCPSSPSWKAKYSVTTPTGLGVVQ